MRTSTDCRGSRLRSRAWRALGASVLGCVVLGACQPTTAPPASVAGITPAPATPATMPTPRAPAPIEDDHDDTVPLWVRSSWRLPSSIGCRPKTPAIKDPITGHLEKGGQLDKEIIRRVIRRHINAVRACNEGVMVSKPFPTGRVMTRFAIDAAGKVKHTCVVSTTLNQTPAEACIVDEMLRWEFPKPLDDGWVVVDYPFVFMPDVPPAPKDEDSDNP